MAASLDARVAALEQLYGAPPAPRPSGVFELVIWENAAYLVDDERREEVFARLENEIGIDPAAILAAAPEVLARVLEGGGMHPQRRADKLHRAAEIASELGLDEIERQVREDPDRARRSLRRFPGIGEPGADRILLLARARRTLATDSNALRVLVRLGFAREESSYARTYRGAAKALEDELSDDFDWLIRAHQLLRTHGKELCRRTPDCDPCPLAEGCAWFAAHEGS